MPFQQSLDTRGSFRDFRGPSGSQGKPEIKFLNGTLCVLLLFSAVYFKLLHIRIAESLVLTCVVTGI